MTEPIKLFQIKDIYNKFESYRCQIEIFWEDSSEMFTLSPGEYFKTRENFRFLLENITVEFYASGEEMYANIMACANLESEIDSYIYGVYSKVGIGEIVYYG